MMILLSGFSLVSMWTDVQFFGKPCLYRPNHAFGCFYNFHLLCSLYYYVTQKKCPVILGLFWYGWKIPSLLAGRLGSLLCKGKLLQKVHIMKWWWESSKWMTFQLLPFFTFDIWYVNYYVCTYIHTYLALILCWFYRAICVINEAVIQWGTKNLIVKIDLFFWNVNYWLIWANGNEYIMFSFKCHEPKFFWMTLFSLWFLKIEEK